MPRAFPPPFEAAACGCPILTTPHRRQQRALPDESYGIQLTGRTRPGLPGRSPAPLPARGGVFAAAQKTASRLEEHFTWAAVAAQVEQLPAPRANNKKRMTSLMAKCAHCDPRLQRGRKHRSGGRAAGRCLPPNTIMWWSTTAAGTARRRSAASTASGSLICPSIWACRRIPDRPMLRGRKWLRLRSPVRRGRPALSRVYTAHAGPAGARADIVIGSRFVTVKKPRNLRMVGSYLISWAIRLTTRRGHLRPHQRHAYVQPRHGGGICRKSELRP